MSIVATATLDLDYVQGHLRYGHFEAGLTQEQLDEFQNLGESEQADYIKEVGEFVLDDYRMEDYGEGSVTLSINKIEPSKLSDEQKKQIAAEIDNEGLGYWVTNYGSFEGEDQTLKFLIEKARQRMKALQEYLDNNEIYL